MSILYLIASTALMLLATLCGIGIAIGLDEADKMQIANWLMYLLFCIICNIVIAFSL